VLISNLKDKAKGQVEIIIKEGKKINCLHFAFPIREGTGKNTHFILGSSSNSTSPAQSKVAAPSIPKPPQPALLEVQNTQQQIVKMSAIKPSSGN